MGCSAEEFSGDVELDIVSVAVESQSMTVDDVTEGELSRDVELDVVGIAVESQTMTVDDVTKGE